jgi:DNA-binding LacI/PurR family transcriptional regulator
MLLSHGVDGMVFTAPELSNRDADHSHYARLLDQGARIVFVNGPGDHTAVPSVGVDEAAAGQLAAEHLLDLGHRRIGFVAGPERYLPTREKANGLWAALNRRGIELDRADIVYADGWTYDDGARAMAHLLDRADRPTAVIASSDVMAIGALAAAARRGIDVPRELSIVGFDGVAIGEHTRVPLTTIAQPTAEIARTAIDLLIQLIDEPTRELPHAVFRPRLIVRGSTAIVPF